MWELCRAGGTVLTKDIPVWHERLDPGGLSRDGAQPHFTPDGKHRCALEHWVDVRWDSSGILRSLCGELVKLGETGSSIRRQSY